MVERVGWTGPVVSFEPVGAYNSSINARVSDTWRCFPYALGSEVAEKQITVFDSPGLASLRRPDLGAMRELLPRHAVEIKGIETTMVRPLRDVFDEVTRGLSARRVLLKIDTQGYDLEVFRGASGILDRVPVIRTEVSFLPIYHDSPDFAETIREMNAAGYEISGMFPTSVDPDLRAIEFDCVLVSPAHRRP
jgi:FkbM family methyltransferase